MVSMLVALAISGLDAEPYPRIGMLWSPYNGKGGLWQKAERYSMVLVGTDALGLKFRPHKFPDLSDEIDPTGAPGAQKILQDFLKKRPSSQVLVETYFYEANKGAYPEDSPWWFRDKAGKRVQFWEGCFNMATSNPAYIDHITKRIDSIATATKGATGVYLDNLRFEPEAKTGWLKLLAKIRARRPDFFVMANAGWASDDLAWVAPQINGIMYEDSVHHTDDKNQEKFYQRVAKFDDMMRKPTRSIVEVFGKANESESAWRELCRTLVYTDAAFLFSDSTFGHRHDWRTEWNPVLGATIDAHRTPDGKPKVRKFINGLVAWNPSAQPVTISLPRKMKNLRTGTVLTRLVLKPKGCAYLVRQP